MSAGHTLICGQTMSGKTELAKMLARGYLRANKGIIVHDKFWSDWRQDESPERVFITDNNDKFIE